jgi:hypothetical protein
VPKEQYGRANGLMSLVQTGPGMVSPVLAGALLPLTGLQGILPFWGSLLQGFFSMIEMEI